jgi:hypothetical protein
MQHKFCCVYLVGRGWSNVFKSSYMLVICDSSKREQKNSAINPWICVDEIARITPKFYLKVNEVTNFRMDGYSHLYVDASFQSS